jgi:acetyl esterase/lipase
MRRWFGWLAVLAAMACDAGNERPIPTTISPEWQDVLRGIRGADGPTITELDDPDEWRERQTSREEQLDTGAALAIERHRPVLRDTTIAGLAALEITPATLRDETRLVVHLHGGGYAYGSPRTSLVTTAGFADAVGLRVLSLAYPLTPLANWQTTVPAVVAALREIENNDTPLERVALFGESAGGGLAAGVTFALRDQGHAMPGALILWSPWTDVTENGDSYQTLREFEPAYRYDRHIGPLARAYADPADQKHPWVSPVYGDFTKGYPPTLIVGGTRELFLSNFVRLYQGIEAGGGAAKLDLYEGLPHMFPHHLPEAPETQLALAKSRRFLDEHLNRREAPAR